MSQIRTLPKREGEEYRIEFKEYKGYEYLDIRLWYEGDDGEWHPTKKGVTISRDNLDEFLELLHEAAEEEDAPPPKQKTKTKTRVKAKARYGRSRAD